MSGYRTRVGKATLTLWLLVVLADAAWAVTSNTAMLFGTLAIVTVAALFVLVARGVTPPRQPVRVRVRARH
jgi:dolichyl-phosphate-mannose--protein O-mannosyl transferase